MAATKLSQYQAALRHLGEARLATITDDVEARYALDEAWETATTFVLRTAPWRFALKQIFLTAAGTDGTYTSYLFPTDWLRTHAVFVFSPPGIRECPIGFRELGTASLSVPTTAAIVMRYVSNTYLLPAQISTTGDLHSNTTIDAIPSTTGMLPGHGIAGAGIPVGATIVSVNSSTSITISVAATATGAGVSIGVHYSTAFWPEHFAQVHAAYLAFSIAERVTGSSSTAQQMSQLFGSLLPEAVAIDAVEEDPWLPHQRSGALVRAALAMIGEGDWRFALKTALMSNAGVGEGGLTYLFANPLDWSRTRSLYRLTGSVGAVDRQRRPFDIRERAGFWHTNATDFYAEYISSTLALDSTKWPNLYMQAVLRRLAFSAAGGASAEGQQAAGATWKDALQAALAADAEPPDAWLAYQLSGAFARCVPAVISKGYWRQFLKSLQFNAEIDQDTFATIGDYPYRFTTPPDLFKTQAIFVPWDGAEVPIDIREHEGHWSTATAVFMARYVSTAALDPAQWPDSLAKAVHAYLGFEAAPEDAKKNAAAVWTESLAAALREWSVPESPWLRFQFDGRYWEAVKFVLAAARWRGAIKTVTLTANATLAADGTISGTLAPTGIGDGAISPSYSAVFNKPGDWYRTIWIYRANTSNVQVNGGVIDRQDIDYRDEGGAWHANWDTIQVRYLSRDGLAGVRAPPSFRNAVMAWLQYEESGHDQKRLPAYQDLIQRAEEEDDTRERPMVNSVGRFARARQGRGWGGNGSSSSSSSSSSSGAGSNVGSEETILTDDSGTVILTP